MNISYFISILIAFTLTTYLAIPKIYSICLLLLFLISIPFLLNSKFRAELSNADKLLMTSFALYTIGCFLLLLYHQENIKEYDKPSRFLFILPVILLLLKAEFKTQWTFIGIALGSITACIFAIYQTKFLGIPRAVGFTGGQPIRFGNMALLFGLLSFSGSFLFYQQKKYALLLLSIVGGFSGLGASFLSGSRGGWIALPILLFFLFWQARELISKKQFIITLLSTLTFIAIAIMMPQTNMLNRIYQAKKDIQGYAQGRAKYSSLGTRFEMWKASLHIIKDKPILGAGESSKNAIKKKLIEENQAPKSILNVHAHNDYLETFSTKGIVGLFLLLGIYLIPLKLFLNVIRENKNNWNVRSYAIAGAIIPMSYMDFGLSSSLFSSNITTITYLLTISIFWGAIHWSKFKTHQVHSL